MYTKIVSILLILECIKAGIIPNKHGFKYDFPELKYVNNSFDPCDNFYDFACGNYAKYNPIGDDQLMWDNFKMLQTQLDQIALEILQAKIRKNDCKAVRKAKDMYNACVNMDMNDFTGLWALEKVLKDLGGWPLISDPGYKHVEFSWELVGSIVAQFGIPMFINANVRPYLFNANINMIQIARDPLVLPASAVKDIDFLPKDFLPDTPVTFQAQVKQPPYVQFLNKIAFKMQSHIGTWKQKEFIEKDVLDVLKMMLQIKKPVYPYDEAYAFAIDTVEDLQKWSDQFSMNFTRQIDWITFFNAAFANSKSKVTKSTKVYVGDQESLANVLKLVESSDSDSLMNFIITRLMTYMVPDSTTEMWTEFNSLYRQLKYTVYSRPEYCMRKVASSPNIGLSMAISHEYQNYYFNLNKISHPKRMIENLMNAFFELLDENEWMDEAAKEWVRFKANHMLRLTAFPDFVYDGKALDKYYSKLRICRHNHFENSQNIRAFNFVKQIEVIDQARNREIWTQSPLIVNAYYNQMNNKITFPAGIMNPPFYSGSNSIIDYTRIGALIGHEITHGFDSNGRNTDANGTMVSSPWSQSVKDAFEERKNCFITQYSKYHIDELGLNVNGTITITENIADNGGLREAYRAFRKLANTKRNARRSSEYTTEQLFFISYAAMWCKTETVESLRLMYNDVHAPSKFRVLGTLSNMAEFAHAFNCPVGSKMNPEHKCVLW